MKTIPMKAGPIYGVIFFLFAANLIAQNGKQVEYKADRIKYLKQFKGGAKRLIGNVEFKHQNAVMNCDSAYFFDNNTIEAYGRIFIRQGDSLMITGTKAQYNGNTKLGTIEGGVQCTEKDMTLNTSVLNFDLKNSTASYFSGGTILSKDNILTSKSGQYHSPSKTLFFKGDVNLKNSEFKIRCDTLHYITYNKTAIFIGPTRVENSESILYCEKGWYNANTQICQLTKKGIIQSGKITMRADSIFYDRKKGFGRAQKNVIITDSVQKVTITGNFAEHFQKTGKSLITNHTLMKQQIGKDTLFLSADTLVSISREDSVWKRKAATDSIFKKTSQPKDSSLFFAYHHVRLFKSDFQGVADSVSYKSFDSLLILHKTPILWTKRSQFTGKEILVRLTRDKIKSFDIPKDPFIAEEADSLHYSQIKGKTMQGFFEKDSLKKITVNGNAQVNYYLKSDKGKLKGLNKTECSSIVVHFQKEEISRISFIKQPKSIVIPIKDVNPKDHELKGFTWLENLRPKSPEHLVE